MIGYVLGINPYIFEEDARDNIYRYYCGHFDEIFWDECDLKTRVYKIQNNQNTNHFGRYDGIELTSTTVETRTTEALDDIFF